jgi:hypothetical protein
MNSFCDGWKAELQKAVMRGCTQDIAAMDEIGAQRLSSAIARIPASDILFFCCRTIPHASKVWLISVRAEFFRADNL